MVLSSYALLTRHKRPHRYGYKACQAISVSIDWWHLRDKYLWVSSFVLEFANTPRNIQLDNAYLESRIRAESDRF